MIALSHTALALATFALGRQNPVDDAQPAKVAVRAVITAPNVRQVFASALPETEKSLARVFAAHFAEQVGFLRFDPTNTASDTLTFDLDRRDRTSTNRFIDIGFWVRLTGVSRVPQEVYWLTVRPGEQADQGIGLARDFIAGVRTKLAFANIGLVQDSLLRQVPVARGALLNPSPLGWVLSLAPDSLCILPQSQLDVVYQVVQQGMSKERRSGGVVTGGFAVTPPAPPGVEHYLRGVFLEAPDPATNGQWTADLGFQAAAKEVYVKTYRPDANACRGRADALRGAP